MKKVTLHLHQETYDTLKAVVDCCNFAEKSRNGGTSHGQLTVEKLLLMLAEDAAMTYTRPAPGKARTCRKCWIRTATTDDIPTSS